ncbi:amino acid permease [Candidatus Woesearchaeota archaeon]|nr:amino acid permease [Candidatus Woesearchaeota archaeon]
MKHHIRRYHLKRDLNLFTLSLYGIGVIIGAGIYSLLGVGAGMAGNAVWLSFVLAAFIAGLTGLSYAELCSMFPKDAAEYNFTKKAFRREGLSFIMGWLMVFAGVVSAVAVAYGFAGYFTHLFGGEIKVVAFGLLAVLSLLTYLGNKSSSLFNGIAIVMSLLGLLIIIGAGLVFYLNNGVVQNLLETPPGIGFKGIIAATGIVFFAFLGFEEIVNLSEETKHARRTVPLALMIAIAVSTIFYVLVSLAAVNLVGWERLASSPAPLTEALSSYLPGAEIILLIAGLFATANTPLILLIVSSRIIYGMSSAHSLPRPLSMIGKRGTPVVAVAIVTLSALGLSLLSGIKTLASVTDISLFLVYAGVNAAMIGMRFRAPTKKREFRVPFNIGNFPVLAFVALLLSLGMVFSFEAKILAIETGAVAVGFFFYHLFREPQQSAVGNWEMPVKAKKSSKS